MSEYNHQSATSITTFCSISGYRCIQKLGQGVGDSGWRTNGNIILVWFKNIGHWNHTSRTKKAEDHSWSLECWMVEWQGSILWYMTFQLTFPTCSWFIRSNETKFLNSHYFFLFLTITWNMPCRGITFPNMDMKHIILLHNFRHGYYQTVVFQS